MCSSGRIRQSWLSPAASLLRHSQSPTPAFSPPPPDVHKNLRKSVRWQPSPSPGLNSPSVRHHQREDGDGEDEDDDEERDSGPTLAINAFRGRLGACYWDPSDDGGKLLFLNDAQDSDAQSWDLVALLVEQVQPTMVLTSSAADPSFLAALSALLAFLPSSSSAAPSISSSRPSQTESDGVQLEYRPQRDFLPAVGRVSLTRLHVREGGVYEPQEARAMAQDHMQWSGGEEADRMRALKMESFLQGLDSNSLSVGCAGALISHLLRSRGMKGEVLEEGLEVAGLELMALDKIMLINQDALYSLQIFNAESHASIPSDKQKEGLSLFGVLNLAQTPLGRVLMKKWFLRPSLELEVIERRLDAVECFLRTDNQTAVEAIQSNFKRIKNVPKIVKMVERDKAKWRDWKTLLEFVYGIVMIQDSVLLLMGRNTVEIVAKFLDCFDVETIKELGKTISDIIDWDESALQNKTCIRSGVNAELDELRRQYSALPSLLSRIADTISSETSTAFASSLSLVYFPQLGYLICVPHHSGSTTADDHSRSVLHDEPEGWEYQFTTEHSVYYKNGKCRDIDEHFGDLSSFAADKEIEILEALAENLVTHAPQIQAACANLSELDCLLAFAEAAKVYEWNRPTITASNETSIKGGRHPLVELCVASFVENDLSVAGSKGIDWSTDISSLQRPKASASEESVLILTGANYSGKSVLLKQFALITFMAHLGSYVPARQASIGLTDRILTRISARESVTKGSSAFMMDLQQISFAVRNATSRSLLVVDEFGKGTESDDGAGLFCGVVEHLVRRGEHAADVLANEMLSPALPICYAHMEIFIESRAPTSISASGSSSHSSAPQHVTYLYRLALGLSTKSHAAACASQFGIDDATVARAVYVTDLVVRFETDKLLNAGLDEDEKRELKESEAIARRFVAMDLSEEACGEMELEEVIAKINYALHGTPNGEEGQMEFEESGEAMLEV